jgi:hypothetical protein
MNYHQGFDLDHLHSYLQQHVDFVDSYFHHLHPHLHSPSSTNPVSLRRNANPAYSLMLSFDLHQLQFLYLKELFKLEQLLWYDPPLRWFVSLFDYSLYHPGLLPIMI